MILKNISTTPLAVGSLYILKGQTIEVSKEEGEKLLKSVPEGHLEEQKEKKEEKKTGESGEVK